MLKAAQVSAWVDSDLRRSRDIPWWNSTLGDLTVPSFPEMNTVLWTWLFQLSSPDCFLARLPSVAEGKLGVGVGVWEESPSDPIRPGLTLFKAVFFFRE